jgi:hypothetical protein
MTVGGKVGRVRRARDPCESSLVHHSREEQCPNSIQGATLASGRPCRREGPRPDEARAARRVVVSRAHDVLLIERHSR